ncbi:MAG: Tfp pilus assembly protein FimT/FimU [Alphaproteobacteria bacterium]
MTGSPDPAARARGFTLIEILVTLAIVGLLSALVVPRLSSIGSASLDATTRRLAQRIRSLREDAALRGRWVRLVVDPARGTYRATVLVEGSGGARFVDDDSALYRATRLPDALSIDLSGPGVVASSDGLPSTLFSPDGWADPAVLHVDDGRGRAWTVAIEPAVSRPRVIEGRLDTRDLVTR